MLAVLSLLEDPSHRLFPALQPQMQFGWSNVGSPGAMLISWLCSSSCRAAAAGQAGAGILRAAFPKLPTFPRQAWALMRHTCALNNGAERN
eukprot:1154466-Pelagomonas_calceolata.AAC.4